MERQRANPLVHAPSHSRARARPAHSRAQPQRLPPPRGRARAGHQPARRAAAGGTPRGCSAHGSPFHETLRFINTLTFVPENSFKILLNPLRAPDLPDEACSARRAHSSTRQRGARGRDETCPVSTGEEEKGARKPLPRSARVWFGPPSAGVSRAGARGIDAGAGGRAGTVRTPYCCPYPCPYCTLPLLTDEGGGQGGKGEGGGGVHPRCTAPIRAARPPRARRAHEPPRRPRACRRAARARVSAAPPPRGPEAGPRRGSLFAPPDVEAPLHSHSCQQHARAPPARLRAAAPRRPTAADHAPLEACLAPCVRADQAAPAPRPGAQPRVARVEPRPAARRERCACRVPVNLPARPPCPVSCAARHGGRRARARARAGQGGEGARQRRTSQFSTRRATPPETAPGVARGQRWTTLALPTAPRAPREPRAPPPPPPPPSRTNWTRLVPPPVLTGLLPY